MTEPQGSGQRDWFEPVINPEPTPIGDATEAAVTARRQATADKDQNGEQQ